MAKSCSKANTVSLSKELFCRSAKVDSMSRKQFLKYYIGVLEQNIKQAQAVLKEKRAELKKLK